MIRFREATADERSGVIRSQWINRVAPPRRDGKNDGLHWVTFGRREHEVSHALATRMVELVVDELLASPAVVVTVAESDGAAGEVMGWVAYEPLTVVHFVCVPSGYGRAGLGTHLLQRAGVHLPCSWSTPNGRALLKAAKEKVDRMLGVLGDSARRTA
jgi:hypothetical protein